jgi:hypothetical protein
MAAKPSALTTVGIAKETVAGTPVAATAFIPSGAPTPKDEVKLIVDKGLRGSMVDDYGETPTVRHSTFDFGGDVFPDVIGWLLTGVLGDITTTGASAPFTHNISVLNTGNGQPPSYTLTDNYAVNTRQYPGAMFSDLDIKFSGDGLLTYTAKAVAYGSMTTTAPTASYTSAPAVPAYVGTISIGGSGALSVMDGDISIKRPVTVIDTVDGSQNPYALWAGPVSVSGKLTLVMEDETQLTNYLTGVNPALDMTWTQGAAATLTTVQLHMSNVVYQSAEIGRGKDYVELAVSFNAKANATDVGASGGFSPIKATIKNAITSGTYK